MWNPVNWIKRKLAERILKKILKEVFMWEWFNGKKTVIGAIALFLALNLPTTFGWFNFEPSWLVTMVTILTWIGNTLGGVGVAHKVAKAKK